MRVGNSLLEAVYEHRDWRAQLQRQCERLRERSPSGENDARLALDLAAALELAEPNRIHAIEMYLLAWKAARLHPEALRRALALCLELGQQPTAAKVARILYLQTRDPESAAREGMAWLDADQPDKAVRALLAAAQASPGDDLVGLALATARREWPDPRAEIDALRRRAAAGSGEPASELLVQAARIQRMLGDETETYGELLAAAVEAWPMNESAFSLLEAWLARRGERDRLMRVYVMRAEAAPHHALEVLRRAGTKWVLEKKHVGLGIQLLTRCLELGYASDEPIPGHLATLALLYRFSELAGAQIELLNLIGRGLARSHSEPETAALAAVGLDIAWGRLRQPRLAHPVARILASLAPRHPALVSYGAEGGLAKGQALSRQRDVPQTVYIDEITGPQRQPPALPDLAEVGGLSEPEPESEIELELDLEAVAEPTAGGGRSRPTRLPTATRSDPAEERRAAPRLAFPTDVRIRAGDLELTAVTRDISEGGLFFFSDETIAVPSRITLSVQLPASDGWTVQDYPLSGRIVRAESGGYGVELDSPPQAFTERISHLFDR